ncbi:MAG: hypothetical protein WC489_00355 [Patescibacteria group bacterium]
MKTKLFMLTALTVILTGAMMLPKTTEAYRGDINVKGPNYSEERHTAMVKAFESKDYNAWKNLMQGKGRVSQVINKDNFATFAKAHELSLQGKSGEANKLRQSLGLGLQNGSGKGQGMGRNATR